MSPENKQARLKELSNPDNILSDQEYAEKERLEEELDILQKEDSEQIKPEEKIVEPKRQKKSLLDIVLNKLKKKPATWDEIQQLKLERQKAILKRDISEANYRRKNPSGKKKKEKLDLKLFEGNNSKSSPQDFRNMVGSNDKNKYKGLIP